MAQSTCPHCRTTYESKPVYTTKVARCRKCGEKFKVRPQRREPGQHSTPSEIEWDKKPVVERELTRGEVAWLIVGAATILLVSGVVIYEVFFV